MIDRNIDPDEILNSEELGGELGESDECEDPIEILVSMLNEILENGMPVYFMKNDEDPMAKRLNRQNEILNEINMSLKAISRVLNDKLSSTPVR